MNNLLYTATIPADTFAGLPEFIWSGIFKLLITAIGGIIVASFTTLFLKKREEITRISGTLTQRRLDIYQNLLIFSDRMSQKVLMPGSTGYVTLEALKETGLHLPWGERCTYSKVFESTENFESFFSDLETHILSSKLFLDDESVKYLYYIQSYFAIINGLYAGIESFVRNEGKYDSNRLKIAKTSFLKAIGTAVDKEISQMCEELEVVFVDHISNIKLERRQKNYLRYDFFMAEGGYIMQKLSHSILSQKEKLLELQSFFIAAAIFKK